MNIIEALDILMNLLKEYRDPDMRVTAIGREIQKLSAEDIHYHTSDTDSAVEFSIDGFLVEDTDLADDEDEDGEWDTIQEWV